MADEAKRPRRFSSHSHEKIDSSITEGRYESLKSIERLLDNDVRDMLRQRRTSLPVLQVGGINLVSRGRTSELTDCMQLLATARREAINGLFPNLDAPLQKSKISRKQSLKGLNVHFSNAFVDDTSLTDDKNIQVNANDIDDLEGKKDSNLTNHQDNTEWQDGSLDNGCISKHRASIHDDDFQHFLGIRYLEICNKRRESKDSDDFDSNKQSYETVLHSKETHYKTQTVQGSRSNALNVRILALARSRRRRSFNQSKERNGVYHSIKLPPILTSKGIRASDSKFAQQALRDFNMRRASTGVYSPKCSTGIQKPRNGVPCNAESRARNRYPRRLEALLSKFRDVSSVIQKTEQEKVIKKLDVNNEQGPNYM